MEPSKGAIALCSKRSLGLITSESPQEVTYGDGTKGMAWTGIHLTSMIAPVGSPWSSRNPIVIHHTRLLRGSVNELTSKVKITIFDGLGEYLIYADDFTYTAENGVVYEDRPPGKKRPVPNGQQRILIKAWRGCTGYDQFTTEAQHSKPQEENIG